MVGDLATSHALNTVAARELGAVVVAVDYRLAPENPFPPALEDCHAALTWFAAQAPELGVDPARHERGRRALRRPRPARPGSRRTGDRLSIPRDPGTRRPARHREHAGLHRHARLRPVGSGSQLGRLSRPGETRDHGRLPYATPARGSGLSALPPRTSPPFSTTHCATRASPTRSASWPRACPWSSTCSPGPTTGPRCSPPRPGRPGGSTRSGSPYRPGRSARADGVGDRGTARSALRTASQWLIMFTTR